MNKKIKEMYIKLGGKYEEVHKLMDELEQEVKELADFEIGVTYCHGDGVLLLDMVSGDTATFDALKGATKEVKIDIKHFKEFGI